MPRGRGCATQHPADPRRRATSTRLRGLGDRIDLHEVEQVYLPLSRLLNLYVRGAGAPAPGDDGLPRRAARPRRRSSSASPARWPSASRRPPGSCASCSPRWPEHPDGGAGHDRRLPATRTPSSSAAGLLQRKGFPESYDRRALLRFVAEVKSGEDEVTRAGLLAPDLRHRARRADRGAPARRAHRRGPQRAAAARASHADGRHRAGGQRLLRLLGLRRRRDRRRPAVVRRALPAAARDGLRRPGLLLPPLRRASATPRRPPPPSASGARSTSPTWSRTSCPPAAEPPWCSPSRPTTRYAASGCASSDRPAAAWRGERLAKAHFI